MDVVMSKNSSNVLSSSQDFVRALKAALDPPNSGGPSKIETAVEAWRNANFYVPSKAEIIAEWILSKFLKDKDRDISVNPIFDTRYWQLMSSLIESQDATLKPNDLRTTKSWLTTLLHRIPVGPVVLSFLKSYINITPENQADLAASISSCLSVLWAIAVQRMNIELLQECLGAFLCSMSGSRPNNGMSRIGKIVSMSYRDSLINSSNKKRLHQPFLQLQLRHWLQSFSTETMSSDAPLKTSIIDAGIETLFNLDILRQNYDSNGGMPLVERLQSLLESDGDLVLEYVPELLIHYIRAIKRHKGALFGHGSQFQPGASLNELHESGMFLFMSMVRLVDHSRQDAKAWRTRVALLQIVDNENLFDGKQIDGQMTFNRILELALLALRSDEIEQRLECIDLAVRCVSIIAHVDYDVVQPYISHLLPLLLQIPIASDSHFTFLEIVLIYHTKTRTMDALLRAIFSSVSSPRALPGGCRKVYQICSSSPIMHTLHLERVSRALYTSLTESQCLPTVEMVLEILKAAWDRFYVASRQQDEEGGHKKKRKISSFSVGLDKDNADELAVAHVLSARLISVTLSSLPMPSLSSSAQEEVRRLLDIFRRDFLQHTISKSIKLIRKRDDADLWSAEVVLAAHLRLFYALNVSRNLSLPTQHDEKLSMKMVELIKADALLPELTLELFRVLFYNISIEDNTNHEDVIDQLLRHLENNFPPSDVHWSGNGYHLTKGEAGKAESSLAIMHMITERCLPEIDHLASAEQLERLLKVIISVKLPSSYHPCQAMQPEHLLMQILHSAQFWELPKIRNAILELLETMTSSLDPRKPSLPKTSSMLEKVAVYQHLLFFPMEYLSWQLLNDLIKRALTADVALSRSSSSSAHKEAIVEALVVLRVFLKRAYIFSGSVAHDSNNELSEFLVHLGKDSVSPDTVAMSNLTGATLDLVEVYFSKMLKASKKNGPEPVLKVLATYASDLFVNAPGTSSRSFISLVNLLTSEFPQSSLPDEIPAALRKLHKEISSTLLPSITLMAKSNIQRQEFKKSGDLISGWYSLLCLGKWLELAETSVIPLIGQKLTSRLMTTVGSEGHVLENDLDELCVATFAILLQELDVRPISEHSSHLDLVVAVYVSFSEILSQTRRNTIDINFGKICKKMALEDYIHVLLLITDSLSNLTQTSSHQLPHLVHLGGLVLREHPSHSLVHIQKFATGCINVFTEHSIFADGVLGVRLQVLEMVAQYCSDQPAALRSLDMAGVWLLLSKFLAPSQVHDDNTELAIFHKIVAILSSLMRLRRDLVLHGLPHLGMILRRLLLSIRSCRPQLGARQTAIVMNTQPRWISATHAMGAEEAKVLGRLLESLNTKTTVRAFPASSSSTNSEAQKAESLAKPFSKHAAYVLKAYIEAMNDPLCVLPLDVRKELQPGIFALCSVVSEHSRDSLMVSALDAGGKALLKNLWKEYDKQRYVGRG